MGSLVGGVSLSLDRPKDDTEDEVKSRLFNFLGSGVTGFATFGCRDALVTFGLGLGFSAGPFASHPIRLFCFIFSVDGFPLGVMVDVVQQAQARWSLFG